VRGIDSIVSIVSNKKTPMKSSLVLVFMLSVTVARAQFTAQYFSVGDSLFVWAKDGLSLRSEPLAKSSKKRGLSYGTPVVVVGGSKSDSITVIPAATDKEGQRTPAFRLHGRWLRVSAGRDTGYVFDGYLSKMEPFKPKQGKHFSISAWLEQTSSKLSTREYPNGHTIAYANHIVESEHHGEGGGYSRYYFPRDWSFHDGFLLLNYFSSGLLHISREEIAECEVFILTLNQDSLFLESIGLRGGIYNRFRMLFLDDFLIIEWGKGC